MKLAFNGPVHNELNLIKIKANIERASLCTNLKKQSDILVHITPWENKVEGRTNNFYFFMNIAGGRIKGSVSEKPDCIYVERTESKFQAQTGETSVDMIRLLKHCQKTSLIEVLLLLAEELYQVIQKSGSCRRYVGMFRALIKAG